MRVKSESEVAQSCPTLSDPMDCSLPGSSIHGILQARVLEWVAIALSHVYLTLKLLILNNMFYCLLWSTVSTDISENVIVIDGSRSIHSIDCLILNYVLIVHFSLILTKICLSIVGSILIILTISNGLPRWC